eukprot:gb/GEZN01019894.1/.p1 GENE.gb/GEZN01019894.1/~~gb/GEZN01019894.1/.p1  ORF type:complete len:198 (+),score=46.53 gb/GEZN01019894.1/:71-664(+)
MMDSKVIERAKQAEDSLKDLRARVEMIEKGNGTQTLREQLNQTETELKKALAKIKELEANGAQPTITKTEKKEEKKEEAPVPLPQDDIEWRKNASVGDGPHPFVVVRKLAGSTGMSCYSLNETLRKTKDTDRAKVVSQDPAQVASFKAWCKAALKNQFEMGSTELANQCTVEDAGKTPFFGGDVHNLYSELLFLGSE